MKSLLIALMLPLLLAAGCSPYWYKDNKRFIVQESRLNWVEIYYQEAEDKPRIRCSMRDNGQITILEGHSVTVGDDFNIDYEHRNFGDVRKYHYTMDRRMFRETLQILVDLGLVKLEPPDENAPLYPKVMVNANIDGRTMKKFTTNEDLITEIRIQLFQFKMSGM